MIDTHSHILFGIDDGARTIEESISILEKMSQIGYKSIILTPHYISPDMYDANNSKKKELVEILKKELEERNINIDLYLGNEIFIQNDIDKKIIDGEIYTLNNSSYLLIELPLNEKLNDDLDIIYELINQGAKVILAHPERYTQFQKNPKELEKYLELGVLLQGNIDVLSGKNGTKAKKLFKNLLKNRQYFILGSDIHRSSSEYFKRFPKLKKKVISLTDEEYFNDLLINNPQKILESEN
ncbi:MAG: tyrosine-protein phosphatase [Candidatus Coprovivens sp.]